MTSETKKTKGGKPNRRCLQTKCTYNNTPQCPTCIECGTKPNLINPNCKTCKQCEGEEGEIRDGGDKKNTMQQPMGIMVKETPEGTHIFVPKAAQEQIIKATEELQQKEIER